MVGNPSLPSYTPEMLMSFPAKMTFMQRLKNTIFNIVYNINQQILFYPKQNELLKKYISNDINLEDALFNVSLVLLNTHESIAFPSSTVPCMKLIGDTHIIGVEIFLNKNFRWFSYQGTKKTPSRFTTILRQFYTWCNIFQHGIEC